VKISYRYPRRKKETEEKERYEGKERTRKEAKKQRGKTRE
jgi:hypothetical protein